jgi:hypothetical protein
MAFINFTKGRTPGVEDQTHLYFLAMALVPDNFEELEGLQRGDIQWRFLALVNQRTGALSPLAFSSTQLMMQFTKIGRGLADLPQSTDIIRAEVALLRDGPCPYDIWLDPTADAFRSLLQSGAYTLSEQGLESLL